MNILSQLSKARFALKRKFDDLKQVKNHTNLQLEETFKPITEPLHELLKENKKQKISNVKDSIKVKREMKKIKNKGKRYSRVPRLSDTRYSAKGTKGKWRYASSKARLKCVMGVRVGEAIFFDQSIGIDETNTFQLKFFI